MRTKMGFEKKVSINVQGNKTIIDQAGKNVREDWEEIIKKEVEKNGQPQKLVPNFFEDEDDKDWTW